MTPFKPTFIILVSLITQGATISAAGFAPLKYADIFRGCPIIHNLPKTK